MSNIYRGPSIDASYQVSVHLIKRFQKSFLEIDQPETRIAHGGKTSQNLFFCSVLSSVEHLLCHLAKGNVIF
jgi:hypothetical protein